MSGKGRPLRFLALVAFGWTGARLAVLWPQTGSLPAAIKALVPLGPAIAERPPVAHRPVAAMPAAHLTVVPIWAPALPTGSETALWTPLPAPAGNRDPLRVQIALLALVQYGVPDEGGPAPRIAVGSPDRLDPLPSRWSASAWAAFRPGQGIGAAPGGGQLGGSQAGVRLAYMLDADARVAAFARFTAPLSTRGREVSFGLEWQPGSAPVRIVAEQRFAIDGGGSGPGLGAIAGVDATLAHGFRLESYGQAGVIRRRRIEPYVDGAARATRDVIEAAGVRLALGGGAWGGAQRDVTRLDLGPSATLALPVAGQTIRVALDWRQRVAGNARPGSGPALTVGSDF
ncbi:hypothetical protein ACMGDH_01960 [Sphingomonas sp. DT-207]|uniref:hypothetical protein n=1 Tax=Sphingomonas sp. DT-207 TaxID=3396167 RepID=UPI003F19F570